MENPRQTAGDTISKVQIAASRLQRIREEVLKSPPSDRPAPPAYEKVLADSSIGEEVGEALVIIARYREKGFGSLSDVRDDLAKLVALNVNIGGKVGYLNGLANDADTSRRISKSKTFTQLKSKAEELKVKLTDQEADHLSRSMIKDEYKYNNTLQSSAEIVRTVYYSIKSLTEILNSTANRELRELQFTQ
jgi:hypothetical protein